MTERLTLSLSSPEFAIVRLDLSILQMAPPLGELLKLYPRFLTSGGIHLSPPPPRSLGRTSQQHLPQGKAFPETRLWPRWTVSYPCSTHLCLV